MNNFTTSDDVDINTFPELGNKTIGDSIENPNVDDTLFLDVTQELKLPVTGWLDSKKLGCRIEIRDDNGANAIPNAPEEKINTDVTFNVEGRVGFFKTNLTSHVQLDRCPPRRMRSIQKEAS